MSNGKEERMVGTINNSIRQTLLGKGSPASEWKEISNQVLYRYRIGEMESGLSPFKLMYGIAPKNRKEPEPSSLTTGNISSRELELMDPLGKRATRIARQRESGSSFVCVSEMRRLEVPLLLVKRRNRVRDTASFGVLHFSNLMMSPHNARHTVRETIFA